MVGITLTAELLGVSGGHGSMVGYNKRFSAMNGRNANLACLADMQAAAALGRAWSDFGLWLLPRGRAPVYLRLTGAAKWAEWYKRSKAAPCRQPSKSLPVADITIYPPAAQQQFESMARVPVLTASSLQPAEGMARSPLRVVRVVLPFDHTAEPPPPGMAAVRILGPAASDPGTQLAFQESMRRPLRHWGMREAVLLHHPSDPSAAGMSRSLARAKGTLQSRSRQRIARSWHVRTGMTLACRSSRRGAWMAASSPPSSTSPLSLTSAVCGRRCRERSVD